MGMKKDLYGIGGDILKGVRKGLSPKGSVATSLREKDIKAGTKKIFKRKPGSGNFKNLGY